MVTVGNLTAAHGSVILLLPEALYGACALILLEEIIMVSTGSILEGVSTPCLRSFLLLLV